MKPRRGRTGRLAALVGVVGAVPRLALACPVCFGASDSPMAAGLNNGVLALLFVTVAVLGCFAAFFIYLMRRASKAAQQAPGLAKPVEQGGNG